jgi:hypothetical protein
MYACSPSWDGDWMTTDDLERILGGLAGKIQAAPFGPETISLNHGFHFSGGEPFLNFPLLCTAVEMAGEHGIPSLFVETNCFWCVDDETTAGKLRMLKEKGLHGILISVNPFYLEYVPFERTERAVRTAVSVFGNNTAVYQPEFYRRFVRHGFSNRVSLEKYLRLEGGYELWSSVEFFFMGRAPYALSAKLNSYFRSRSASMFFSTPCTPPFLRSWHNHFDNYGNFIPGYCGGISIGDCRDLDRLLQEGIQTDEFPVLKFILDDDFSGMLSFSRERGYVELESGYLSKCHLCVDMRKHLVGHGEFRELGPAAFYEQLA